MDGSGERQTEVRKDRQKCGKIEVWKDRRVKKIELGKDRQKCGKTDRSAEK